MQNKQDLREISKKVIYNLKDVNILSHFCQDFEYFGIEPKKKNNLDTKIKVGLLIDAHKNEIKFDLDVKITAKPKSKIQELMGVRAITTFSIQDFKKTFNVLTKDDEIDIPNGFLAHLLGVCFNNSRGMLIMINTNKKHSNIVLPPIEPLGIIEKIEKKNESN